MQAYLIVFFGAGLGGCLRHTVNLLAAKLLGTGFPWGTFLINVSGSLVMGLLAGYLAFRADQSWTQNVRLFLLTGILGGYTTFSAFSLDAALLYERGQPGVCALYIGGSVGLALAGVFGGLAIMRILH
jgi:CrcB protein